MKDAASARLSAVVGMVEGLLHLHFEHFRSILAANERSYRPGHHQCKPALRLPPMEQLLAAARPVAVGGVAERGL